MKTCSKCSETKSVDQFQKDKSKPDGVYSSCKECTKKWRKDNKNKIWAQNQSAYEQNKEKYLLQKKEYYDKNKKDIIAKQKKYYLKNRNKILEYQAQWREDNVQKYKESVKAYSKNHRAQINQKQKERKQKDPAFHMRCRLATRIWAGLKGKTKDRKMEELLGCSWADLKLYLESKFVQGMSWDNRSSWHIDHIRPLVSFDLADPEQLRQACHYTNLQPLWAKDNLSKGAKYSPDK